MYRDTADSDGRLGLAPHRSGPMRRLWSLVRPGERSSDEPSGEGNGGGKALACSCRRLGGRWYTRFNLADVVEQSLGHRHRKRSPHRRVGDRSAVVRRRIDVFYMLAAVSDIPSHRTHIEHDTHPPVPTCAGSDPGAATLPPSLGCVNDRLEAVEWVGAAPAAPRHDTRRSRARRRRLTR